jgi:hypothetical protein
VEELLLGRARQKKVSTCAAKVKPGEVESSRFREQGEDFGSGKTHPP